MKRALARPQRVENHVVGGGASVHIRMVLGRYAMCGSRGGGWGPHDPWGVARGGLCLKSEDRATRAMLML